MNPRIKAHSRENRDPTTDSALRWRMENPEAADAADAAQRAANTAALAALDAAINDGTAERIAALADDFGDWAVVADVLRSEGLRGDALLAELAKCKQEAPDAAAWMRANF